MKLVLPVMFVWVEPPMPGERSWERSWERGAADGTIEETDGKASGRIITLHDNELTLSGAGMPRRPQRQRRR